MPRKILQRSDSLPYHVTARANNREEFPISINQLWQVLGNECLFVSMIYQVEFQAVVLMPNHFHIIVTVPCHDLGKVMNEFLKSVSKTINQISGRSGHVFGGPYYWSLIGNGRYYGHALKYVYRNPVKAQLCREVHGYPYSTLSGLLGISRLPFPIYFTRVGMELNLPYIEPNEQLNWLNSPFPKEAEALIQKGLRRKFFDIILDRSTRRPVEMLKELI